MSVVAHGASDSLVVFANTILSGFRVPLSFFSVALRVKIQGEKKTRKHAVSLFRSQLFGAIRWKAQGTKHQAA